MTTLFGLLFLFLTPCLAISNAADDKAAGKRTITQVVELLEGMMAKSKEDGASERKLYAKFKCYCDTNTAEKTSEIDSLTEEISILETQIESLQSSTGGLSQQVAQLDADMASNEQSRNSAQSLRKKSNSAFLALQTDLTGAIAQMKSALETLSEVGADQTTAGAAADSKFAMAGYGGSLLAKKVQTSVKAALIAATVLMNGKVEKKQVIESFIQAPFTGTYTAQSGEVVGILKDMRDTFKANLATARKQEAQDVESHGKFMDTMTKSYNEMKDSHTLKQGKLGSNDGELSTKKTQLATALDAKADAEEFLAQLTDMCTKKADEYQQRVSLRTNEEAAIAEAVSILNSDAAFATFGGVSATSTGAKFLQTRSVQRHVQAPESIKAVTAFLAPKVASSPRIARIQALLQAENPFSVVITEIGKMLEVIQKEGKADIEQEQFCLDERTKHNGIVSKKTQEINGLNEDISSLDATINDPVTGLKKEIDTDEILLEENDKSQKSETAQRTEENLSYQQDIATLVEAESLLEKAIKALTTYYETISPAMIQTGKGKKQSPPATWEGGADQTKGAYAGQSGGGMAAINMLEFILDETHKEEMQAHDDEKSAQHAFEDSMTTLTTEEARLRKELARLNEELSSAELELEGKQKLKKATTEEKEASEAYLAKIKRGCDWIDANIENRQQSRADETKALLNAKTIIKATPAYTNAVEAQRQEDLGDCKDVCNDEGTGHAKCKACLAKTSVPGYCAGHPDTTGC
jgi:hypothetical protein